MSSPLDTTSARRLTKLIEDAIAEERDVRERQRNIELLGRMRVIAESRFRRELDSDTLVDLRVPVH